MSKIKHDPEFDPELQAIAERLTAETSAPVPPARAERAMFVEGAAAISRPRIRVLVPAALTLLLIAVVGFAGRSARPDELLFPVRKALTAFGLAESTLDEARSHIDRAAANIGIAEGITADQPLRAARLASEALFELGQAQALVSTVESGKDRAGAVAEIATLRVRAHDLLFADLSAGKTDRSGSNSGPGSGDGRDDDSGGSGSGDDDGSDDSGGSGSGDDDGSGSGSGGDDDDDDGGSGGSGSGSGSDDEPDEPDEPADD